MLFTNPGKTLLPIARSSISLVLGRAYEATEEAAWLEEQGACFVTLTQRGRLRGSIGTLQAHRSLLADIKANALATVFRDPRFAPLAATELDHTAIEVSLLSPMQAMDFSSEVDALAQLQPGLDGAVLEFGPYRSTFLPQVWEQLPSAGEFIAQLKYKAGLPPDFWAEGVRLQRYTVRKWRETDIQQNVDAADEGMET